MEKNGHVLIWIHYIPTEDIYETTFTPVYIDTMPKLRMSPIILDTYPAYDNHLMERSDIRLERCELVIKEL